MTSSRSSHAQNAYEHNSAAHVTSHLFFCTVNSTASGLLVWKRLVQIQDVLPLFTLNNQIGLPCFSHWFKCCLSSIAKCIFIPENVHHKRKTVEQSLDVFFVSLSEMKCSVWIQEDGGRGKAFQGVNNQCIQKLKYLHNCTLPQYITLC